MGKRVNSLRPLLQEIGKAWYDFKNSPTVPFVTTGHSGDTGISDVYYSYSDDHAVTSPPAHLTPAPVATLDADRL